MLRFIANLVAGIGALALLIASNFVPEITRTVLAAIGFVPIANLETVEASLNDEKQKNETLRAEFSEWKKQRQNGDPIVYTAKAAAHLVDSERCSQAARAILTELKYKDIENLSGDNLKYYVLATFDSNNAPAKIIVDCFSHNQGMVSATVSLAGKAGANDDYRNRVVDVRDRLSAEFTKLGAGQPVFE